MRKMCAEVPTCWSISDRQRVRTAAIVTYAVLQKEKLRVRMTLQLNFPTS